MKIKVYGLALALVALCSQAADARNTAKKIEDRYVARITANYPNFELIRALRSYPQRLNANQKISVTSDVRALVTLHDPKTAEPLESCYTPCTLHKTIGRAAPIFAYAWGHKPKEMWTSDVEGARDNTAAPIVFAMGLNYAKRDRNWNQCVRQIKKMDLIEDREAEYCFRETLQMPEYSRRQFSAYCLMRFDVSEKGTPKNVQARCTEDYFKSSAINAVQWWKLFPKVERGVRVASSGHVTTLQYQIADENGERLPYPEYEPTPWPE
jgi:hypothetical protein